MGRFGVDVGSLLAYEGEFGFTLGALWAYRRRMAGMMCVVAGLMVSLFVPNRSINKIYPFLRRILLVKEARRIPGKRTAERAGALSGHFGASLGSVWVSVGGFGSLDGHFAIIVDSLWVYEGSLSKNTHFPHIS